MKNWRQFVKLNTITFMRLFERKAAVSYLSLLKLPNLQTNGRFSFKRNCDIVSVGMWRTKILISNKLIRVNRKKITKMTSALVSHSKCRLCNIHPYLGCLTLSNWFVGVGLGGGERPLCKSPQVNPLTFQLSMVLGHQEIPSTVVDELTMDFY